MRMPNMDRKCTGRASGAMEEFPAFHRASQLRRSEGTTYKSWTHETGLGYPACLEHWAGNFVVKEMYAHAQFVIRGPRDSTCATLPVKHHSVASSPTTVSHHFRGIFKCT